MTYPPPLRHMERCSIKLEKGEYVVQGFCGAIPNLEVELASISSSQNHLQVMAAQHQSQQQDQLPLSISPQQLLASGHTRDTLLNVLANKKGESWALKDIVTTPDISKIVQSLKNGTAVAVSDGSFKDEGGTAAWIIESHDGTQRMIGRVLVPGYPSDHSAYRSELAGLYSIVLVVETIKEVWGQTAGSVVVACDGKEALRQAFLTATSRLSCQNAEFDLISGIRGYVRRSKIIFKPTHVKGHQDDRRSYGELTRLEKLNVEADCYAKEYWAQTYGSNPVYFRNYFQYEIPYGMCKVTFLGTRVVKKLTKYLRESIEGGKAADYWINKKERLSEQAFHEVDWECTRKAMEAVSLPRRHWVAKFESGFCATGRMMKIWKQRVIDNCPCCGAQNETTTHILQCPCSSAQNLWEKSLSNLQQWLRRNKTSPDLTRMVLHILSRWRAGVSVPPLTDFEFDSSESVFASQSKIGWRQFIGGWFSLEWARVQQEYYQWIGIQRSGKR